MIKQEKIQVPIPVIIKKISLRSIGRVRQPIFRSLIPEMRDPCPIVALVDEQLFNPSDARHFPGITKEDIRLPIPVHIGNAHPRFPAPRPPSPTAHPAPTFQLPLPPL